MKKKLERIEGEVWMFSGLITGGMEDGSCWYSYHWHLQDIEVDIV
jgi:hypothetical protein